MKWCSITKEGSKLITVNKTKDLGNITTSSDVLKFIHKKNPNKGKFQSIKLAGPYTEEKNIFKWVVYYELPVNKNHENTTWNIKIDNKNVQVFDGVIIIHAMKCECDSTLPMLCTSIDVHTDCAEFIKDSVNMEEIIDEEGDEVIDDEEDENIDISICTLQKEDRDDDAEELEYEEDTELERNEIDLTEPILVIKNDLSITLKDDLSFENKNLEYEKYDYDADIIPKNLMK